MTFDPMEPSIPKMILSIVNYRSWNHLRVCLERIGPVAQRTGYPIYVTDNHSCDDGPAQIAAEFPTVRLIQNQTNVGFGAAHNQAIASTRSKYILVLNPDTLLPEDGIDRMLHFMDEHPWVGVLGPKLLNTDGSLQYSCRRFPSVFTILLRGFGIESWRPGARITSDYFMLDFDHETAREVDWVMGACMLLRRQAIEEVGSFDEGYFLYYEDVDLCRRMWPDWRVVYDPGVTVLHHHLQQSHRIRHVRQFVTHLASVSRFFRTHGAFPQRPEHTTPEETRPFPSKGHGNRQQHTRVKAQRIREATGSRTRVVERTPVKARSSLASSGTANHGQTGNRTDIAEL